MHKSLVWVRPESPRDTKVTPSRVRERVDEEADPPGLDPSSDRYTPLPLGPACAPSQSGKSPGVTKRRVATEQEEGRGNGGAPEVFSADTTEAEGKQPTSLDSSTEVPESPPISLRILFSPSAFGRSCDSSQSPSVDSGRFDRLRYDQLQDLCKQRRFRREDAKGALQARLASMQHQKVSSAEDVQENSDAPVTGTGKRARSPADVMEHLQGPTCVPDTR